MRSGAANDLLVLDQLSTAQRAFGARDFARAESICRQVLGRLGPNPTALRILGLALVERREFEEGITAFRSAIALSPMDGTLRSDAAIVLSRADRKREALLELHKAILLSPDMPDGYANSASVASDLGDPRSAAKHSRKALWLSPTHGGALFNLANALWQSSELAEAMKSFGRAGVVDPARPEIWYGCAMSAFGIEEFRVACRAADRASRLRWRPDLVELAFGSSLMELRRFGDSIEPTSKVIALNPALDVAYSNLAMARTNSGEPPAGVAIAERALLINPTNGPAHLNHGVALKEIGRLAESLQAFARARATNHDSPDLCFLEAQNHLLLGDFEHGWRDYEKRWESPINRVKLGPLTWRKNSPGFSGPSLNRVLVWAEQGVGDEVMFGGLVGEFRGLCGELLLQVEPRLKGLFARSFPDTRVYGSNDPLPDDAFDEQIPMGSLGKWLRPTRESFEGKGGRYLKAQEGLGRRLRADLGVGASEKLIGLSWRSASAETGAARSLSLKALVGALQGVEGARFLNLQYGEVSEEIRALREETGVEVLTHPGIDNREDLEGLAGLIEGCDLVVSVGNATAHLSGALGQKTWVLLPYVAGWRWLHEGERCPWYQSVRLYRQPALGSWAGVLDRVSSAFGRCWT